MKKRNKILKEGGKFDHGMNVPVHPNESDASLAGLILIDEYPIDHAIYQIGDGEFNTEGLQLGYKKLYNFCGLGRKPNAGLTVIVTKSWMFMSVLTQPYHRETDIELPEPTQDGGVPVYLDGFAYAGILNL
jgi:hypothetical protein